MSEEINSVMDTGANTAYILAHTFTEEESAEFRRAVAHAQARGLAAEFLFSVRQNLKRGDDIVVAIRGGLMEWDL